MNESKLLGDQGENHALDLLRRKGYDAKLLAINSWTYDIEVEGERPFYVSVKTARDRHHVRLGSRNSVERLGEGHFVFAFLPRVGSKAIDMTSADYRLLIIPAEVVKKDALLLLDSDITEKRLDPDYQGRGLMVKGYSRRACQREVWARWVQYEDAWHLLPLPHSLQVEPICTCAS